MFSFDLYSSCVLQINVFTRIFARSHLFMAAALCVLCVYAYRSFSVVIK